jgi:hypothetical protein
MLTGEGAGMGHHSRGRSTRSTDGSTARGPGSHRAAGRGADRTPAAGTPVTPSAPEVPADPGPVAGVGGRDLADLAEAARTARRTGWPFGSEVLASADTRRVPSAVPSLPTTPTEQPPAGPRPRRYATHQPTAPFEAVRSA